MYTQIHSRTKKIEDIYVKTGHPTPKEIEEVERGDSIIYAWEVNIPDKPTGVVYLGEIKSDSA